MPYHVNIGSLAEVGGQSPSEVAGDPPSELAGGTPSEVGTSIWGTYPGILLCVNLGCTLGAASSLAGAVGLEDDGVIGTFMSVCLLFCSQIFVPTALMLHHGVHICNSTHLATSVLC